MYEYRGVSVCLQGPPAGDLLRQFLEELGFLFITVQRTVRSERRVIPVALT
jgi:hypothetical protein